MTRKTWIAAAVGLSIAGAVHAQQINDQQDTGKHERAKNHPDTDTQALYRQSEDNMQVQGIQLSTLDEGQIKQVQTTLKEAGYYQGKVDGIPGGATKQALSRFYADQAQLALRGQILPVGAASLGLQQSEIQNVRGEEGVEQAPPAQQQGPSQQERQQPSRQQQPRQSTDQ